LDRSQRARHPRKRPILREEAAEGTASRATVEPDDNLFGSLGKSRREEPADGVSRYGECETHVAYQKKSLRVSLGSSEMGNSPAYDSPISKGTSGMPEPFTEKAETLLELFMYGMDERTLGLVCHEAIRPLLELRMLKWLARHALLN
jgi:hypothetical protein